MFHVQKWVLPAIGSLGKSLFEMKPSKVDCGRNLCLVIHMLMNDLDLIYMKRRKEIALPVNFVDLF